MLSGFDSRWLIVGQAPFTHGNDTDFGLFTDDPSVDGGTWDMHVDSADNFRVALDAR